MWRAVAIERGGDPAVRAGDAGGAGEGVCWDAMKKIPSSVPGMTGFIG